MLLLKWIQLLTNKDSLEFSIKFLMEEFTEKLILRSELYNKLSKAKEKYENDFDTDKVIKQSYYKTRCDRIDQIKEIREYNIKPIPLEVKENYDEMPRLWSLQRLMILENRLFVMANKIAIFKSQSHFISKNDEFVMINTNK